MRILLLQFLLITLSISLPVVHPRSSFNTGGTLYVLFKGGDPSTPLQDWIPLVLDHYEDNSSYTIDLSHSFKIWRGFKWEARKVQYWFFVSKDKHYQWEYTLTGNVKSILRTKTVKKKDTAFIKSLIKDDFSGVSHLTTWSSKTTETKQPPGGQVLSITAERGNVLVNDGDSVGDTSSVSSQGSMDDSRSSTSASSVGSSGSSGSRESASTLASSWSWTSSNSVDEDGNLPKGSVGGWVTDDEDD